MKKNDTGKEVIVQSPTGRTHTYTPEDKALPKWVYLYRALLLKYLSTWVEASHFLLILQDQSRTKSKGRHNETFLYSTQKLTLRLHCKVATWQSKITTGLTAKKNQPDTLKNLFKIPAKLLQLLMSHLWYSTLPIYKSDEFSICLSARESLQ